MKGVGGGYGFDEITEIGATLESAAKLCDGGVIQQQLARLETYLARVEPVFQ
jgi:hypothetical protein